MKSSNYKIQRKQPSQTYNKMISLISSIETFKYFPDREIYTCTIYSCINCNIFETKRKLFVSGISICSKLDHRSQVTMLMKFQNVHIHKQLP